MKFLVLGGAGVISRAIISEGIKAGYEMIALNRGQRKVFLETEPEVILADWTDPEEFARKTQTVRADAVIDMLSRSPEDAKRTMDAFGGETGQWLFTSTTCAYQKPFRSYPAREEEASLRSSPDYPYACYKARMEGYLTTERSNGKK